MRLAVICLVIAVAWGGAGLTAQNAPPPKPVTPEIADQNRRSEALNVEINRKNREIQARNDARKAAFAQAMTAYQAAVAQQAAAAAQTQAAYEKAMTDWKAAVAACKAGDVAKCQKPAVTAAN